MKKIMAAVLSAVLILGNGMSCFAQEIPEVTEAETSVTEAETTEAQEEDIPDQEHISSITVKYLSVSENNVNIGQTQSIVVGLNSVSDELTNPELTVINNDTNTEYDLTETERTDNSILFNKDFSEEGSYEITGFSYQINGKTESVTLNDIGISAVFGVNEEVTMNADAVVVDETETQTEDIEENAVEELAAQELDAAVVSLDADNYESGAALLANSLAASAVTAQASTDSNIVVVLDPGHGGADGGAQATHSGVTYIEKTLNLKIAQYCKAELEQYKGVTVYMTRTTDVNPSLKERVEYAASVGADVFVSIHNNSSESSSPNGAYVYYPNSNYDAQVGAEGQALAAKIASELESLGLVNHGTVVRNTVYDTYPDGSKEDYYGVIRRSKLAGFPGLIVEHAFISNANDAKNYLGSDAALKKLGVADATGIAKYFGLSKSTTVPSSSRTTTPYVTYRSHVQNIGWQNYVKDGATSGTTGQGLQMEAVNIRINPKTSVSGGITYQTHVSKIGWQDWVSNGTMAGTAGQSKSMEAIRIKLTGNLANEYDVYYRVHAQKYGWLGWAKNGEAAGTQGYKLRMEAIQIVLVKKGSAAPGSTENAFYNATPDVLYSAHVQKLGWQDEQMSGETAGTTGQALRVEAVKIRLSGGIDGGISYSAHVQDIGWQNWASNGAIAGTTGQALRVEALRIQLTGSIANEYNVSYRVHVQKLGWTDWVQNGAIAGTTGQSLRVEAVQIKLEKKN